ncbi:WXG100 family type VII secretion target [Nonomuraea dietziae]|uniref:WXG100 family type VII secretion target n=1 Tax=Nonomuraea dietziae TaxID=65515 RepID=UPI0033DF7858
MPDSIARGLPPVSRPTTAKYGNPYAPPRNGGPWPSTTRAQPIGHKVLELLKKAGRVSLGMAPAIAVASTMLANEPGMAQAASNWKNGIAARLDDGIKQLLPQLVATSKEGWIAQDREEFERVVWTFHREIGALRSVLSDIGGMLDEVAAGYRSYWLKMASLAVAALGLFVFAKRLQALPSTALAGALLEKFVTLGVNSTTAILTMTLSSTLKAAGDVMTTVLKKKHQFAYVTPSGDAKVNFRTISIDTSKYPSFREPAKPGALPPGHQNFDWVEPKREK